MSAHDARAALSVALPTPMAETVHPAGTATVRVTPAGAGWRQRNQRALRWGTSFIHEAFWLLVIVLCLPLGVLAIGIPIAVIVRLTLWLLAAGQGA